MLDNQDDDDSDVDGSVEVALQTMLSRESKPLRKKARQHDQELAAIKVTLTLRLHIARWGGAHHVIPHKVTGFPAAAQAELMQLQRALAQTVTQERHEEALKTLRKELAEAVSDIKSVRAISCLPIPKCGVTASAPCGVMRHRWPRVVLAGAAISLVPKGGRRGGRSSIERTEEWRSREGSVAEERRLHRMTC
eukprot:3444380-Pleurochrysis_carterae.AAC.2